ncbi:MAG: hypothetical protein M0D55_12205 [Elusimicrobiota bacterium]|nr:MAG: hypothetical protein M0D55_12205 [Elusimicrobiota bacterium]
MGAGGNFPPAPFFHMNSLSELVRRWLAPLRAAAAVALAFGGAFGVIAATRAEEPSAVGLLLASAAVSSFVFPPAALVLVALSEARDYVRGRGRRV